MPGQDEQITALADRHYARLLRAGEQGLALNPIVDLSAPAHGHVLWRHGRVLEGYEVTKLDWDGLFPESRRDFEHIGFRPSAQRDGIWVLIGLRYAREQDRWALRARTSHIFAHYDTLSGIWRVVRMKPGVSRGGEWADQWQPAGYLLSLEEKAVIARIAQETDMLLDAATTLQDDPMAYFALERILMQRAHESADPGDARRMGAILRPYEYLAAPVADQFRVSAFGKLESLAKALYRELAGKAQSDSTGLMAVATVSEATLCPPYEPAGRESSAAADFRPPVPAGRPAFRMALSRRLFRPGSRREQPPGLDAGRLWHVRDRQASARNVSAPPRPGRECPRPGSRSEQAYRLQISRNTPPGSPPPSRRAWPALLPRSASASPVCSRSLRTARGSRTYVPPRASPRLSSPPGPESA